MRKHALNSPFVALFSKHSITLCSGYFRAAYFRPELLNQTGILAFFGPIGNRPSVTSCAGRSGLGGAYSISIPAAKSSARVSISSSNSWIIFFRRLAMRLSRESLNSARRSRWHEARYSTSLRSRSSAVAGFRVASLDTQAPSAVWSSGEVGTLTNICSCSKYGLR